MTLLIVETRTQVSNLMTISLPHHTIFKYVYVLSWKQYRNDVVYVCLHENVLQNIKRCTICVSYECISSISIYMCLCNNIIYLCTYSYKFILENFIIYNVYLIFYLNNFTIFQNIFG